MQQAGAKTEQSPVCIAAQQPHHGKRELDSGRSDIRRVGGQSAAILHQRDIPQSRQQMPIITTERDQQQKEQQVASGCRTAGGGWRRVRTDAGAEQSVNSLPETVSAYPEALTAGAETAPPDADFATHESKEEDDTMTSLRPAMAPPLVCASQEAKAQEATDMGSVEKRAPPSAVADSPPLKMEPATLRPPIDVRNPSCVMRISR